MIRSVGLSNGSYNAKRWVPSCETEDNVVSLVENAPVPQKPKRDAHLTKTKRCVTQDLEAPRLERTAPVHTDCDSKLRAVTCLSKNANAQMQNRTTQSILAATKGQPLRTFDRLKGDMT